MLTSSLAERETFTMDEVRDALDMVSKHNFDSSFASTEWSIVYNLNSGEVRYYHREDYTKYYGFQLKTSTQDQEAL